MKKSFKRIICVILCVVMLSCGTSVAVSAADSAASSISDSISKGFYNALNVVVEGLVSAICKIYPTPPSWLNISEYDSDEIGFLAGRDTYRTEAADGAYWSLGYSSRSVLPDDVDSGVYNLGRDLTNRYANGVYDDQRIRVAFIDDNSGDGAVIFGAIDSLGVTSTDIRTIRKAVLEYCDAQGIKVASINISATHTHSALDTQGVSTEFFKKLLGNVVYNAMGKEESLPGMDAPDSFKAHFIAESVEAVKEAIDNRESGKLYFSAVDCSEYIIDKRGLIAQEDIPDTAAFCFVPDDSSSAKTYITDISCHPTSFSAGNGLVGSDYIYYLDEYIKNEDGGNLVSVVGALGQLSREIEVNTEGMDEYEEMGASAKTLGYAFGEKILAADFGTELEPILNVTHKELFIYPENSILLLACQIRLVNNRCFVDENGEVCMATEMGYLEFGNEIGIALFPGEFYPETFWGDDIAGNPSWDGTEWPYGSLFNSVNGVKVYEASLTNDAIGYVLTDSNFAFMGHIIGEEIADEVLSVGKHTGSYLVSNYLDMIENYIG